MGHQQHSTHVCGGGGGRRRSLHQPMLLLPAVVTVAACMMLLLTAYRMTTTTHVGYLLIGVANKSSSSRRTEREEHTLWHQIAQSQEGAHSRHLIGQHIGPKFLVNLLALLLLSCTKRTAYTLLSSSSSRDFCLVFLRRRTRRRPSISLMDGLTAFCPSSTQILQFQTVRGRARVHFLKTKTM